MNNKFSFVAIMVAVLCMMTSCLKDDSSSYSQYNDVAVTSFSLGTLKKIVYTKRNGKDSTYTTTASCSSVQFTIDNVNNKIYNVDSLTRGIVTSKALVTISTKNSSYAYLKSYVGDTLTSISSSDSLDFSQPRIVRVVANDGSWYKDYTVDIRVHQQPKDSVYWTKKTTNNAISKLQNMRALCFRGNMLVYGTDNNVFKVYASPITDGATWTVMSVPFDVQASVVTDSTTLYACSAGTVFTTQDNVTWTNKGTNRDIKTLFAATKYGLYAVANDGRILISSDCGATWTDDKMYDDKSLMPTTDIQGIVTTTKTNDDINTISLFGNTEAATDTVGVMWSKIVDNNNASYTQAWQRQQNTASTATHMLPALSNMTIVPYAGGLVMIGGDGRGACTTTALQNFYLSQDYGLSWWKDTRFYFPSDSFSDKLNFAFAVDSNNYMWLIGGGTGEVWRGFLTQMIWTNN